MSTLASISRETRSMISIMRKNAKLTLYSETSKLLKDFQKHAPKDTGYYRSMYRIARNRFSSGNTIASTSIYNDASYAEYMEEGTEKNQAPWYYPGKKKKRSGKLFIANGRVWAGGLNPGKSLASSGAINSVFFNNERRQIALTKTIANNLFKGIR